MSARASSPLNPQRIWGTTQQSPSMNEELIQSAVSFLQDKNVDPSPMSKKIEFLQSKGLNEQEIEEAVTRARESRQTTPNTGTTATTYREATGMGSHSNSAPLDYYSVAPQIPERTWKDYFIMATATAGVTYGLYQVVTKYLLPSIVPPGQSRVDDDKKLIEEEFVKVEKILEQMDLEQKEIKEANEAKLKDIDVVIDNVNDFLSKYNKDKIKFDDDLRLMKLEVDNLQNSIQKNMKLTKDNLQDELSEISEELQSLKNLIKARSTSNGALDRKVVPVSSIPSASDILKKVKSSDSSKAKVASVKPDEPEQPAEKSGLGPKESEQAASQGVFIPEIGYKTGGIPDWQMAHKEAEEKTKQPNDKPSGGIPAWQQASKNAESDKVVEEQLKNVGIPEWQLNAKLS